MVLGIKETQAGTLLTSLDVAPKKKRISVKFIEEDQSPPPQNHLLQNLTPVYAHSFRPSSGMIMQRPVTFQKREIVNFKREVVFYVLRNIKSANSKAKSFASTAILSIAALYSYVKSKLFYKKYTAKNGLAISPVLSAYSSLKTTRVPLMALAIILVSVLFSFIKPGAPNQLGLQTGNNISGVLAYADRPVIFSNSSGNSGGSNRLNSSSHNVGSNKSWNKNQPLAAKNASPANTSSSSPTFSSGASMANPVPEVKNPSVNNGTPTTSPPTTPTVDPGSVLHDPIGTVSDTLGV